MTFPYACKVCGAEAFVDAEGQITRTCPHAGCGVIAERTSNLFGEGGAEHKSLAERARAAIDKLVRAFTGA